MRVERENRNPEITSHMATFIKQRRKELRLSLDDVAKRMGGSKAHIWQLETGGSKNPSLWMILGICEALHCSLNALIGRDIAQPIYTESEMALIDAHREIFGLNALDKERGE
jgi:transcriptional regulator with XRE-family HTH domain